MSGGGSQRAWPQPGSIRARIEPAATVFINDDDDVEAAAKPGVTAIRFTTAAQLRSEPRDLGLPVAPG